MKRLLLSFLLIVFFSSIKVSGQTTFDFETNVSGYNTKTVTQSANSYMLQITSADYPLSNSMNYLGIAISGNASLAPEYLNNSPRESSVTISLQGGGAFNLNSFRCDDITGAASTMVLTSSKGTISFSIPGSTSNTLINVAGHVNSALFQNISSFTITESSGSGLVGNLDDFVLSNFSASSPTITSATYSANTGTLNVTGSNFQANGSGSDVAVSKLTVTGEGGSTYTLTSAGVEISSSTSFSVTVNATDKAALNMRLNKNGTASTNGTTYNLAAASDWMPGVSGAADLTGNGITVSNVAVPAITSATYDASTGSLTVTGTGFLSASGATNDIVANKFTFTGEGGTTYTLTDSSNPEITSGTSFTITLSATDKAAINQILNKNGTASTGGTTYNLAAAEDWAAGADVAVVVADVSGNGITVSNVAVPAITSATYDASNGSLTVTGTGFLSASGATNDIVANKFTFTGEGGTTYTLTDSSNPEITSGTSFTITLSATDKSGVNQILNKNGTSSAGGTTYNLAAAEDWAAGADAAYTVADLTGNGITVSNVILRLIAGLGNAINFERSRNEGIQVADHSSLNLGTGSFTIESWVKRSSGSGFFTILGKQTGSGSGVFLRFNDDKLSFAAGNYPASTDVSSVSSISDNNWHHIAAVMDASGKTMKIYIDGVLDASNAFATNYTISSTAALGIGFKPNFGEYFDGSMDDVRFWSTARTADQIKEYMNTPLVGTETGLVAYWNFEEGSGTSIDDRSQNTNTGTLQNSDGDEFVTGNTTYSENVNDSYISLRLGGSDLDDQASATAVITALPANGKIYQTNDGYAKGTQITAFSTQLTDNGGNPRRVIYEPNLNFTGSDSFSFKVNDGTSNSTNTQIVNLTVFADTQAPTITSVNSTTANGSYKPGDVISIQVNFSESVTVTGTPQLTLETGTTDRVINYASGSGSNTLTFSYTVQTDDTSADLDYNGTGALALNGGTIKDASGNDGTLTLAAPGAANSLGANKSIVVDGIVPIVTSVSSSTNNAGYKAGNVISIQVNFSEAVTVTGIPQLTLETGTTDRVVNYYTGSGTSSLTFRYTVQTGDLSSDLDYISTSALALNSGTIKDAVGNSATLSLPTPGAANSLGANKAIVIDAIVPTVSSVSSSTANGTYKTGDAISIQVNLSEAVTVTGTPQLTLETGLTDQVINYVSGSGTSALTFNYTVQAGDVSADLDYTSTTALALNSGIIRDAVSNNAVLTLASPGTANSLGNNKSIVIDGVSPSVSSVGVPANATYITGQNLDFTVNFDENVTVNTGGGIPRIALTLSTGGTVYADYLSGSGSSALTFRYTVVSGNADTDGISVGALALNGGTIKDAAGNNANLTLNSVGSTSSVLVDAVAPAVTSVGVPANATYIINNNLNFTVYFDENVTVNTVGGTPRIALTLSTGGTVYADYLSGSGTSALVFRYTVVSGNSDSDGIALGALSLNGGTMKDAAGNNATLTLNSVGSTSAVLVDAIVPGVSSMVMTPSSIKAGQTSTLTITFSEAVTGFTNADLTLANGTLSAVSSSDGGITWTATFTPTASVTDATNVITLDNTGVADAAGNAGTGTTNSNNYAIDTARPTATIAVADAALSAGETSTVTITFSEAVTGFTNADLTLANGTLSAVSSGDGGITWTATFTPTASITDATNLITLDNTGVADAAGNAGTGTTNSNNYAIDTARPTATIVVADAALSAGETSTVTITFSEAVTGFTNADLTIANGTLSAVSSGDGGITWTATFTPTASVTDATNVITLDNTGVADAAGNAGTGTTNSNNYAIDTARPTATIVVADAALFAGETSTVTITFSEAVTGLTNADLTIANGTLSAVSSSDGGITWTATFTPTASITDATNVITLDNTGVADAAGNAGTGTTNSNNYAIDTARPTASIVVADAALSAGETSTVTITFSEAVTGFTNADLTIANGTLSAVSSADGGITWTATFTPTASVTDATNVITLDNTGVADAAGNAGTGTTNSNNYTIETSFPAVASVSLPSDGTYVAGQNLDFTVNFNENVLVNTAGGTPRVALTLATGGLVYADYLSGSGTSDITFRYTVAPGNSDTDGIAIGALSLNGGTVNDAAGNNATLTLNNVAPSAGVLVDAILPVLNAVSIISNNPVNSIAKTGDVITISLTASETIASPAVTIAGHAATVSGSGSNYSASFTMLATDTEGQVVFNISFSDPAGNAGVAVNSTSNSTIVTFDKTAPGTPVSLAGTVGDTRITLNWAANSENDLAGYSIYGGTTANPTTLIATVNRPATTYTHTGLTNGTGYYYRISAVDNAGNESAVTGDVTAIPRAQQTITFNALTPKTYGDLDFDPGASASSGLTVSYISDNPAVATIVSGKVHITGAGTAVITANQPGNPAFYAGSDVSQVLTVNKKDINVSLNATPEIIRTYNNSTVAALVPANYSLQGLETGDDVSITGTAAYDNKNSGTNKTVTVNSFVLSGTHKDNYNLTTTTASTVGTITAKNISLTLNAAPAINKVYNGSSVATLVPDNYALIGIESGDAVGVTGIAAYADKNAGSGKPVTVTSFALTGTDKDNYTLTTTSATTTGNIVAKELSLSLNASPLITKTYDGTAAANLLPGNYSLSGVETGDMVTVTGTAAYSNRNAGTGKLISVNSFTLAGTDKNNYTLTTASATTTGEIKTKEISLSLNASPVITKVYDATAAANLSATNYALSGVESGDDVSVTGTAIYSDKNAENGKTVTVSGLNLSGAQSGNYNLTTSAATTTGNITVKDITLSINPIPAVSKVYDGTTVANLSSSNYVLTGVEPGDMLSVTGTAAYSDKNAGTAKSVMVNSFLTSGADQGNYHLINTSITTTGTILPSSLTVAAADKTKFQNTVNPDLTVSFSGFISGEGVSNLTTLPIATTPAVTLSDVGTYPIIPGGGIAINYSFQYVPGTLTIVSGAPTSISLAAAIVYENRQAGTVTGSLSSASNVPGAVYTYTLVSGSGATDNGLFSIKDNQLITSSRLNYEEKATYSIRVRSTTQYNVSLEKEFLISIRDVNEPPVFAVIPNTALCYTTAGQKITVNGTSAGPETGQAVTMSVSSNNPDLFEQLSITDKGILSYRIKEGSSGEAKITISIKDDGGVLNDGNDTYSQSFDLKVNRLPDAGIVSNKPADTFKGEEITLTATGGSAYRWRSARGIISGQNSATLNIRPEETTTYRVEVTTAEGCVSEKEITITVKEDFIKLDANNIISPNGDGKNDNLIIKNLDMYPNNEVKIFDRAGRMVFSKVNYTDEWNGTFQGSPLAEDTYYYVVDFGAGKPKLRGYITIVRD